MTCIIGLEENGRAWIGADSSAIGGYENRPTETNKVFKNRGYTIGYTTSFRMGQLLKYSVSYPDIPENLTEEFMVNEFVEPIRKIFKDFGFLKVSNNEESGGDFLVGVKNKIFHISSDFQVQRYIDGIYAIGAGSSYALGSMEALKEYLIPEKRILTSLEITSKFSIAVSGPYKILEV